VHTVREHFPAIEADWQRFYGRDLGADLYGPGALGFRRFSSLLEWLPPEAALWRSTKTSWSEERELLALQVEMVDSLRRAFILANSKKGARQPDPVRIPRPWDKSAKRERRGTRLNDLIREMKLPVRHDVGKDG
jgi:hypothetical protein